jgi:hypothetical protein
MHRRKLPLTISCTIVFKKIGLETGNILSLASSSMTLSKTEAPRNRQHHQRHYHSRHYKKGEALEKGPLK